MTLSLLALLSVDAHAADIADRLAAAADALPVEAVMDLARQDVGVLRGAIDLDSGEIVVYTGHARAGLAALGRCEEEDGGERCELLVIRFDGDELISTWTLDARFTGDWEGDIYAIELEDGGFEIADEAPTFVVAQLEDLGLEG